MAKKRTSSQLTPLELEIMKVLWETGATTVQTVQQKLPPERTLAYTTVQTMLNVLYRKGKVRRVLKDRAYHYSPAVNRLQAIRSTMGDIIDRLFGGSPEDLVLSLVETRHLRPEQLAELTRLVNESRKDDDDASRS
jgi:predicted transcriptional regulator